MGASHWAGSWSWSRAQGDMDKPHQLGAIDGADEGLRVSWEQVIELCRPGAWGELGWPWPASRAPGSSSCPCDQGGRPQLVLSSASNTSLDRVSSAPFPLSRCSRVSKWISSICSLDVL